MKWKSNNCRAPGPRTPRKHAPQLVVVASFMLVWPAIANSALTPIHPSSGLPAVLDSVYGVGNYERIDDSLDRFWSSSGATVNFVYDGGGYVPDFGYFDGLVGGTFTPLIANIDNSLSFPTSAPMPDLTGFRWAVREETFADVFLFDLTSNPNSNPVLYDQMVTFLVTAGPSTGNYVVGWEDFAGGADNDYEDTVMELSGVSLYVSPSGGAAVPEPSTLVLLALAALGLGRHFRHRPRM